MVCKDLISPFYFCKVGDKQSGGLLDSRWLSLSIDVISGSRGAAYEMLSIYTSDLSHVNTSL